PAASKTGRGSPTGPALAKPHTITDLLLPSVGTKEKGARPLSRFCVPLLYDVSGVPPKAVWVGRARRLKLRPLFGTLFVDGKSMASSAPRTECSVIRHFQERMPYGLFVPDVP